MKLLNQKSFRLLVTCHLLLAAFLFSGFTTEKPLRDQYDVVLKVSPVRAKAIYPGATFEAIEGSAENLPNVRAIVQLKIHDVLLGDFIMVEPKEGPTKLEQLKEATEEKSFWKILTLDFESPQEEPTVKKWITVAVRNPEVTFGITNWQSPAADKFKLYLKRAPESKDSFILVAVLKP